MDVMAKEFKAFSVHLILEPTLNKYTPIFVNSLPLPQLLMELMASGRWKCPENSILIKVIPFLQEEILFLATLEEMDRQSQLDMDHVEWFYEKRSKPGEASDDLPWRDSRKSIIIATNKHTGEDVAIALDYRLSASDPRVIATNWHGELPGCPWELVCPTFEDFTKQLGLI